MFAMATGEDEFPKCPLCQSAIPVGDGTFPFDLWIGARPKSQSEKEQHESDCVPQLWDRQHNGHLYRPFW